METLCKHGKTLFISAFIILLGIGSGWAFTI